jgi:hypothetical protein
MQKTKKEKKSLVVFMYATILYGAIYVLLYYSTLKILANI